MRPHATLRTPDGQLHHLGHGDILGRLWTAALTIDDARISEAHAMVSLRGDTLKLLGLRGRFAVKDKPVAEVELRPGLRFALARGLVIDVVDVILPDRVLVLWSEGFPRRILSGVCSLLVEPRVELVPGYRRSAAAHIWSSGDGWRVQVEREAPQVLDDGSHFTVAGRRWTTEAVALATASGSATRARDGVQAPMRIVAQFDTVHIHRAGEPTIALGGIPARIISELVAFGGPTNWQTVAGEVWRDISDRHQLRRKWDVNLSRLRSKLKAARVRTDLVRADGSGHFELLLHPGDQVVDRT